MRIALISDTHGQLDDLTFKYLEECDEIWHAGDIGSVELIDTLLSLKPIRAVYGNIDDAQMRRIVPENQFFEIQGLRFWMTHIGGRPGAYKPAIKAEMLKRKPNVFICGHSHICLVKWDEAYQLLHLNPGAAGNHGFHPIKTMLRFTIGENKLKDMEVIELGKRGA